MPIVVPLGFARRFIRRSKAPPGWMDQAWVFPMFNKWEATPDRVIPNKMFQGRMAVARVNNPKIQKQVDKRGQGFGPVQVKESPT